MFMRTFAAFLKIQINMKTKTTYKQPMIELIMVKGSISLLAGSQTGDKNDYPSGGDENWE